MRTRNTHILERLGCFSTAQLLRYTMLHGRHPIPLWYCGFDVLLKSRENELGNAKGLTVDVLAHASRWLSDGILGRILLALRDVFTGFLEELHEGDP